MQALQYKGARISLCVKSFFVKITELFNEFWGFYGAVAEEPFFSGVWHLNLWCLWAGQEAVKQTVSNCWWHHIVLMLRLQYTAEPEKLWLSVLAAGQLVVTLFVVVLMFCDWFQSVGFPHSCCFADHSHFSQVVSFIKWGWLLMCLVEWDSPSII